jgi:hypothetical protein
MQLEGFDTAAEARRELVNHGYSQAFSSPGRPGLWARAGKRDHRAVAQRVQEATWSIVPYPEPASARPDQLAELRARDRIVGVVGDGEMLLVANEEAAALQELKAMGVL